MIAERRPFVSTRAGATRVLIVDDDCDASEILGLLLGDHDFDVRVALSATEAVRLAATFLPQFAIIDIGLPEMTGSELLGALRTDPRLADCKYLALTGHAGESAQKSSADAGFDWHLTKPVCSRDVIAALRERRGH